MGIELPILIVEKPIKPCDLLPMVRYFTPNGVKRSLGRLDSPVQLVDLAGPCNCVSDGYCGVNHSQRFQTSG